MIPTWSAVGLAAIGPTGFSILVWGAILLVVLVFGYVIVALVLDEHKGNY
jgi:hypothetical protein